MSTNTHRELYIPVILHLCRFVVFSGRYYFALCECRVSAPPRDVSVAQAKAAMLQEAESIGDLEVFWQHLPHRFWRIWKENSNCNSGFEKHSTLNYLKVQSKQTTFFCLRPVFKLKCWAGNSWI